MKICRTHAAGLVDRALLMLQGIAGIFDSLVLIVTLGQYCTGLAVSVAAKRAFRRINLTDVAYNSKKTNI